MRGIFIAVVLAPFLSTCHPAYAESPSCEQLRQLSKQYAGVALSADQQRIKSELVAWFNTNCDRPQRPPAKKGLKS